MVAFLGGVARWRLGARCVARDSRRRVSLSGAVVASMAERPRKVVQQYTLKMDWWQVAAAASYPAGVLVEECAGLIGAPYPAGVLVGTSGLRCLGLAAMSISY